MKKLLFVYPPFCTPASPPYSITNLYSLFKDCVDVSVLDLNVEFHNTFFLDYKDYFKKKEWVDYNDVSKKCREDFADCYFRNHELILANKDPQGFEELLGLILEKKPDFVAFSIVYSSQVFYAFALIKKLKELNIKTVVGGPAVSDKLKETSDLFFNNEEDLANYLNVNIKKSFLDFSIFDLDKYFVPETVLPLKTSSTCYYKGCAFCSHYSNDKYVEYDLLFLDKTLSNNSAKNYFLIDDMIHSKRLLDLAKLFKKHGVNWACQLKPTKDFSKEILQELKSSGLKFVMWGVESGSNKVLKAMNKFLTKEESSLILKNSKESGVINSVFIMFGFPTETKQDFLETIDFLKENKDYVDLVSTSVFGLQRGTLVYKNPERFSITKIFEEKRTLLGSKISYEVSEGLSTVEAMRLRKSHLKFIESVNKLPRKLSFFREHMFFY
ncbi:radical SAM protein [Candidatus Woesearchaeota archaeon]|nr:radical SAM protein [Candidatus Woesearchaeota archaeon]